MFTVILIGDGSSPVWPEYAEARIHSARYDASQEAVDAAARRWELPPGRFVWLANFMGPRGGRCFETGVVGVEVPEPPRP